MKDKNKKLALNCLAIGSLPHEQASEAMKLVNENFKFAPFWAQLAKLNKSEDMIVQFLEAMPGVVFTQDKVYFDNESEDFFVKLEELFLDYEEIALDSSTDVVSKYEISKEFSSTFSLFLDIIKTNRPEFAKGQIVGPFTLSTTLTDSESRCAYYDETLREVILKTLCLKAIWQIRQMKEVHPEVTPIIFIDEPSISQLGTSAFITISKPEVVAMLKEVVDCIKSNGALCAIHCCGKCDWTIPIEAGVDIINLDGFFFAQSLSLFSEEISKFLSNGGFIAWGIVPTLDKTAIENITIDELVQKFDEALSHLIKKGIDKKILLQKSLVTPSCGAGSLSIQLAQKAMNLTCKLSENLINKYKGELD